MRETAAVLLQCQIYYDVGIAQAICTQLLLWTTCCSLDLHLLGLKIYHIFRTIVHRLFMFKKLKIRPMRTIYNCGQYNDLFFLDRSP